MAKILILDDDLACRQFLVKLLGYSGHTLLEAEDGVAGLDLTRAERPDLVITDLLMPIMDGFEFVRQLRNDPAVGSTAVLFCSGTYSWSEGEELARACGVCAILRKPAKPAEILRRVAEALAQAVPPPQPPSREAFEARHVEVVNRALLENVGALEQAQAELIRAQEALLDGWVAALDLRDNETEGHTQRVTAVTVALGRALGLGTEELRQLRRGALLHDIGKIGVPDAILHKQGPLSEDEWAVMRRHPEYGCRLLSSIAFLQPALPIPCCHHERWDGSGYPNALKGEDIPRAARIFAVADVWDALTSARSYKPAWPADKARAYIREQAGKQFDPEVVAAFLALEPAVTDTAGDAPQFDRTPGRPAPAFLGAAPALSAP